MMRDYCSTLTTPHRDNLRVQHADLRTRLGNKEPSHLTKRTKLDDSNTKNQAFGKPTVHVHRQLGVPVSAKGVEIWKFAPVDTARLQLMGSWCYQLLDTLDNRMCIGTVGSSASEAS